MSIRVIATVGVMLCIAVTTFAIYLGVVERVYVPVRGVNVGTSQSTDRARICGPVSQLVDTTIMPSSSPFVMGCTSFASALK
jgi:hypothetical protein